MTDREVFAKAITKAVENGMRREDGGCDCERCVIFDHRFAKAFWGTREVCINCGKGINAKPKLHCYEHRFKEEAWEFHIRSMVLKENPLQYLEQFLGKEA